MKIKYKNVVIIRRITGYRQSTGNGICSTGSDLVLLSRNEEGIKKVSDEINSTGGNNLLQKMRCIKQRRC